MGTNYVSQMRINFVSQMRINAVGRVRALSTRMFKSSIYVPAAIVLLLIGVSLAVAMPMPVQQRRIDLIILHCTATPEGREVTVADIDRWHRRRGFRSIGYHYVIALDGTVHTGRPLAEVGAHCKGHNAHSIGVCYVGGLDRNFRPKDTRTESQRAALLRLLVALKRQYPSAVIRSHRDFAAKACPCFDATREYAKLSIKTQ